MPDLPAVVRRIREVWAEDALVALREVDDLLASIARVSPDGTHTAIYVEEAREIIERVLRMAPREGAKDA